LGHRTNLVTKVPMWVWNTAAVCAPFTTALDVCRSSQPAQG
jgi:hypothetical protein